jgi:hypothetical protein
MSGMLGSASFDDHAGTDETRELRAAGGRTKNIKPSDVRQHVGDQVMSRRLMLPEEVRKLRPELGIQIGRFRPVMFRKIEYFSDPAFARLARADPRFPAPVTSDAAKAIPVAAAGGSGKQAIGVLLYVLAGLLGLFALVCFVGIFATGGEWRAILFSILSAAAAFGLFKAGGFVRGSQRSLPKIA